MPIFSRCRSSIGKYRVLDASVRGRLPAHPTRGALRLAKSPGPGSLLTFITFQFPSFSLSTPNAGTKSHQSRRYGPHQAKPDQQHEPQHADSVRKKESDSPTFEYLVEALLNIALYHIDKRKEPEMNEKLPEAHAAIQQRIETQGLLAAGPPWETYTTDPADFPDPQDWKTDVFGPLAR